MTDAAAPAATRAAVRVHNTAPFRARPGRRDPEAVPAPQGPGGRWGLKVCKDSRAFPADPDPQGRRACRDFEVRQAPREPWGPQAPPEQTV